MSRYLENRSKEQLVAAIRTTARMLVDNRDRADAQAERIATAARALGHTTDTRIDYAEGSSAAYTIALATLAGACGIATVDIAGVDWRPPRDMSRVALPDGIDPPTHARLGPDGGVDLDTDYRTIDPVDGGRNDR